MIALVGGIGAEGGRVNSERATVTHVDMLTPVGSRARYELVSIPFYLVSEIERLLTAAT